MTAFFTRIKNAIGGSVRYKLLVLVLFPVLLVMPIALGLAIYWGQNFTYEQLFIKVNTDLHVAHDVFVRLQRDYLAELERTGESHAFRTALADQNPEAMERLLSELKMARRFTYLLLADPGGRQMLQPRNASNHGIRLSSLFSRATEGSALSGIEIFSIDELEAISPALGDSVRLDLVDTPRARPESRTEENRGMMIRVVYPVIDNSGRILAILDGGVLLNNNFDFVDAIRDLVYGEGSLPQGSLGTVTVFLDDVRVSTNVPVRPGERALGTRVSNEVRTKVLDQGETWIDRAFVVNDWYISSYEPIIDVDGRRVGMLYAGFLEAPFRAELIQALAFLILVFVTLMVLSVLVAVWGAKSIFKPIEAMSQVVKATRTGEARRVGDLRSRDELGELAREFDAMLDLLSQRSQEIQAWADQLEDKVDERTAELKRKNRDLQRTIVVLRQTRQQLVVAEKLAALGELTAGVAHEINNPTQVMLGNLDLISQQLGQAAEPVQEEIELVVKQIYRIQEIINNLLQYARPEEYAGYIADVDVNEVVEETAKLVQHLRKKVPFEINFRLEATRWVRISQQELQQVLVNLVVNAIHALPDLGGELRIKTRNWEDKGVCVCIEDDGAGMDADELSRVFNPFYTTKNQGEGTGLGLSVSYGLIRRYGGLISAESRPGEGSVFTVWLLAEPNMIGDDETIAEQLSQLEDEAAHLENPDAAVNQ